MKHNLNALLFYSFAILLNFNCFAQQNQKEFFDFKFFSSSENSTAKVLELNRVYKENTLLNEDGTLEKHYLTVYGYGRFDKEGAKTGLWKFYLTNYDQPTNKSFLICEGFYKNDIKDSSWLYYDYLTADNHREKTWALLAREFYVNGVIDGPTVVYNFKNTNNLVFPLFYDDSKRIIKLFESPKNYWKGNHELGNSLEFSKQNERWLYYDQYDRVIGYAISSTLSSEDDEIIQSSLIKERSYINIVTPSARMNEANNCIFSSDGKFACLASTNQTEGVIISIYDLQKRTLVKTLITKFREISEWDWELSNDGKFLIIKDDKGESYYILDINTEIFQKVGKALSKNIFLNDNVDLSAYNSSVFNYISNWSKYMPEISANNSFDHFTFSNKNKLVLFSYLPSNSFFTSDMQNYSQHEQPNEIEFEGFEHNLKVISDIQDINQRLKIENKSINTSHTIEIVNTFKASIFRKEHAYQNGNLTFYSKGSVFKVENEDTLEVFKTSNNYSYNEETGEEYIEEVLTPTYLNALDSSLTIIVKVTCDSCIISEKYQLRKYNFITNIFLEKQDNIKVDEDLTGFIIHGDLLCGYRELYDSDKMLVEILNLNSNKIVLQQELEAFDHRNKETYKLFTSDDLLFIKYKNKTETIDLHNFNFTFQYDSPNLWDVILGDSSFYLLFDKFIIRQDENGSNEIAKVFLSPLSQKETRIRKHNNSFLKYEKDKNLFAHYTVERDSLLSIELNPTYIYKKVNLLEKSKDLPITNHNNTQLLFRYDNKALIYDAKNGNLLWKSKNEVSINDIFKFSSELNQIYWFKNKSASELSEIIIYDINKDAPIFSSRNNYANKVHNLSHENQIVNYSIANASKTNFQLDLGKGSLVKLTNDIQNIYIEDISVINDLPRTVFDAISFDEGKELKLLYSGNDKYSYRSERYQDEPINFYNSKKKGIESLVYFTSLNEVDYLFYTPDGYYLGTPSVSKILNFEIDLKVIPFEQFDLKYNRPDIVLDRLGYADSSLVNAYHAAYLKRLKKMNFTEDMLEDDFHLPEIKIENFEEMPILEDQGSIDLKLKLEDSKYYLDKINIWVNDVAIYGANGISLRDKSVKNYSTTLSVNLAKGKNKVQVSVLNQAGAESYKETFYIESTAGKSEPDLYLITIGESKFQQSEFDLTYAAKDAKDIAALFQNSKAYANVFTKTLTNEGASKNSILALKSFLEKANINDQVMVFIAGHGVLDADLDYYFATHEMDFSNPKEKGLAYEDLERLLDGIKPLKKTLIIDACHSGEIDKDDMELAVASSEETKDVQFRSVGTTAQPKLGMQNTFELTKTLFTDLRKGTGATVISSAGGMEFAMESGKWKNGLFTYSLINGVKSGKADLNNDGEIWLSELQKYVGEEVTKLSKGRQQPTSRIENQSVDYRVW